MIESEDGDLIPKINCTEVKCATLEEVQVSSDDFNIHYFNARSIVNKLKDIVDLILLLNNVDVIIITETWLKDDISHYFNLPGFEAIHVCRL